MIDFEAEMKKKKFNNFCNCPETEQDINSKLRCAVAWIRSMLTLGPTALCISKITVVGGGSTQCRFKA